MEKVIAAEHPDWLLVQGDTTTTMAAALAASYADVRTGHVRRSRHEGQLAGGKDQIAHSDSL